MVKGMGGRGGRSWWRRPRCMEFCKGEGIERKEGGMRGVFKKDGVGGR